jgi:hypothetical protein
MLVMDDQPSSPSRRVPVWSGALTASLVRAIPDRSRPTVLTAIKVIHTVIFASVGAAIGVFVWDGIRQRAGRRAAIALGIAMAESAIYVSNNQVCPLTPLAEELGSGNGAVADLFLPDWLSRRIPEISVSALVLGLVLNARALRKHGHRETGWRGEPPIERAPAAVG